MSRIRLLDVDVDTGQRRPMRVRRRTYCPKCHPHRQPGREIDQTSISQPSNSRTQPKSGSYVREPSSTWKFPPLPIILSFLPLTLGIPYPNPLPFPIRMPAPIVRSEVANIRIDDTPSTYGPEPTGLPDSLEIVDETVLPYLLIRNEDGDWRKSEAGWSMYGKRVLGAGATESDDANFAVSSSLPKGWGTESERTSFYRVPLIVVASVILALLIVIGIVVLVLKRRRAHRRAKRRAARARRKELAAAGITDEQINGSNVDSAIKAKLAEIESKYNRKRRRGFTVVKVRRWNAGIRRRTGKNREDEPMYEEKVNGSLETLDAVEVAVQRESPVLGETTALRARTPSPGSSNSSSHHSNRPSDSHHSASSDQTSAINNDDSHPDNHEHEHDDDDEDHPPVSATHFPPAYRPASVRSYRADSPGPSSPPRHEYHGNTSKTSAPGYYPAPSTEEAENAIAVVSRSDGKMPIREPESSTQRSRNHIATDDKRVLETLRLGASAPSAPSEPSATVNIPNGDSTEDHDGPSAPVLEDEFEQLPEIRIEEEEEERVLHPDIPQPPRRLSYNTDEAHLLPSSPAMNGDHLTPSAPPMDMDLAEASAPPLDGDHDEMGHPSATAPPASERSHSKSGPKSVGGLSNSSSPPPNPTGLIVPEIYFYAATPTPTESADSNASSDSLPMANGTT